MMKTLILVCSTLLPRGECTPDTARIVLNGPETVVCVGMTQQAYIAETRLDGGVKASEENLKTVCARSEEHTTELQTLMRSSYAVLGLKKITTTFRYISIH